MSPVTVTGGNEGEIAEKPGDKTRQDKGPHPAQQPANNSLELTTSAWDMNSSTSSLLSMVPN